MRRRQLEPGDICPTCKRRIGPHKPVKICARCKQPMTRSDKWSFTERGTVEHRNCEDPTSYA